MRAAKVHVSLRIRAVSPEPPLLAQTSRESRGTFRQKARSLAPLNGWACAVKICHDGMLEDTNSLDGAQTKSDTWRKEKEKPDAARLHTKSRRKRCLDLCTFVYSVHHLRTRALRGVKQQQTQQQTFQTPMLNVHSLLRDGSFRMTKRCVLQSTRTELPSVLTSV